MEGDYSHHLSPPDGFTEPSLGSPREIRLCPAYDTTHIGHEMREESGVEGLPERVYAKLVESVLTTGFFRRWAEIRPLEDDVFLQSALDCKRPWSDRLSGTGKLPLQNWVHT